MSDVILLHESKINLSKWPDVTCQYAADCLNVDVKTIRDWKKKGKIDYDKKTGKIHFTELIRLSVAA